MLSIGALVVVLSKPLSLYIDQLDEAVTTLSHMVANQGKKLGFIRKSLGILLFFLSVILGKRILTLCLSITSGKQNCCQINLVFFHKIYVCFISILFSI
jgi:hypothetical protein